MWCSTCQQDVPAVVRPDTSKSVCARCHCEFRPPHAVRISEAGIALDEGPILTAVEDRPPQAIDDWQLRRQARELGRKLRSESGSSRPLPGVTLHAQRRLDPPQNLFDDITQRTASPIITPGSYAPLRRSGPPRRPEVGQFIAWLITLVGIVAFASGLATMGWSFAHGGTEIWDPAIGLALAGQGILILGLLLVVTRLWRNSRYASGKLQEVHTELGQLQRTADSLAAMRGGGAPAFYAELVRGASPQMLLANLKGQIDQLATRLNGDP